MNGLGIGGFPLPLAPLPFAWIRVSLSMPSFTSCVIDRCFLSVWLRVVPAAVCESTGLLGGDGERNAEGGARASWGPGYGARMVSSDAMLSQGEEGAVLAASLLGPRTSE